MKDFSFFADGIMQTKPTKATQIKVVAKAISGDTKLKARTEALRSETDKKKRESLKSKLPYVTFSGIFSSRKIEGLLNHSGLICVDLDHIGTNGEIKQLQEKIKEVIDPVLMFVSPSGNGLKAVFAVDMTAGSHLEYYYALERFFNQQLNIKIDPQCKDVSRACFLAHDPEALYSDTSSELNRQFIESWPPPAHSPRKDTQSLYDKLKAWTDKQGIFSEGSRNAYIIRLAGAAHRFGMDKAELLANLQEFAGGDFPFESEIVKPVESIYGNISWFGTAKVVEDLPAQQPVKASSPETSYVRVGVDFFKVISTRDRYGIIRKELKHWNKETIILDHSRDFLKTIPKYDGFCMVPDNTNYRPVVDGCYNLYSPVSHVPKEGSWQWTQWLLEHAFGSQIELGIRYMQILYLYPDRQTVILALVSAEKGTGKTTVLNWFNMLFGDNMVLLSSADFLGNFNFYARKNIIAIEETLFEKKLTMEKLKALATQKYITINEKYVAQYMVPFFGKIILTSNYEDKFALIDQKEIRFFVRKLSTPTHVNHAIEKELLKEIPAFLYYLRSLPPLDWDNAPSRSGFTTNELKNEFLSAVVRESRHEVSKDLEILIKEYFENHERLEEFYASATDIKTKFFSYDNRQGLSWIIRAFKDDFAMVPGRNQRYYPFEDQLAASKSGTPYLFKRSDFVKVSNFVKV